MPSGAVIPTEKKGSTDKIAVLALKAFIASVAQPKMVLQCDSENAIKDVVNKVCDLVPGLMKRTTPIASKGSNGRVEQKNKAIEGMTRTILADVSQRYGCELPTGHPAVSWALRHAGWLLDRFSP